MTLKHLLTLALMSAVTAGINAQQVAAHFDMTLASDGTIEETVTHNRYTVESHLPACAVSGLKGAALRFDGFSNRVKAGVPSATFNAQALTLNVVLAPESYPMMQVDVAETTPTFATVCGNLADKSGFALELSSQGGLRLRFGSAYAGGFLFTVNGDTPLPRGKWSVVTAVLDKSANAATLYLNGAVIGTGRMSRSDIVPGGSVFYIGNDYTDSKTGPFLLNTYCGLIDDITIYNGALTAAQVAALQPGDGLRGDVNNDGAVDVADLSDLTNVVLGKLPVESLAGDCHVAGNTGIDVEDVSLLINIMLGKEPATRIPDFNYPASRYASSLWRPRFHGMPSGSWTNECHGMTYSGGKFHVFFQKNANGPYMSRLNWGHITSRDLCRWTEEPIAIGPDQPYDIKGCWSGCVFDNNGTPSLLYTAVDNARAVIAQADPVDATLLDWNKRGIIINGRPAGLSDDFRDPYYFKVGTQEYVIVGTSKNNLGACTLHRRQGDTWTNDGTIFFQGTNANQHGRFWEMPNVTDMGDGKWLFTCTPLNTGSGVRTLCWVGTIGADGKFVPDGNGVQYLEMGGISRDGYGLLSPTIYRHEGKTLLLGIVPDKLPTNVNYDMGWAHNYSLPREVSLDGDGRLVQRPYSGLTAMRSSTAVSRSLTLDGTLSLAPVAGRHLEVAGEFTVGESGRVGFHLMGSGDRRATLDYNTSTGQLTLDLTMLTRTVNDGGVYSGVYSATLPVKPTVGETLKLHVFLDGSILDIFVNDRWAYSVRVFPTDAAQVEASVFATAATPVTVNAWNLRD